MQELDVLKTIRYVVDQEGRRSAVQLSIKDWNALLQYLEDLEDRALVRRLLPRLKGQPDQQKAIPWQDAHDSW